MALHPFLIGHPYRARYLERVLKHIKQHREVWLTTGGELLDCYRSQQRAKK